MTGAWERLAGILRTLQRESSALIRRLRSDATSDPESPPAFAIGRAVCENLHMEFAHVKLTGDRAGEYVVTEERPDGSLTLVPDTSWKAVRARTGGREATDEEFAAFEREFGPFLPPDGEG